MSSESKTDLEELHKKLDEFLEEQQEEWKHLIYARGKFYQSLKDVEIEGQRDTEQRFKDYEIEKYLNKNQITLDIGANTGFFSINLAKYVKSCDCVEINPSLTKIGAEVSRFLDRDVNFYNSDFNDFETDKKYDIIMSFAADEVADRLNTLGFKQYIDKILSLMKEKGMIFFESQAEDILLNKFEPKLNYLKEKFEIILQKEIQSTYPIKVPKRIFVIGIKKD